MVEAGGVVLLVLRARAVGEQVTNEAFLPLWYDAYSPNFSGQMTKLQ